MQQHNTTKYIRVVKDRDYTTVHNGYIKRNDLSWKAKGIMTYILSNSDAWNINLSEVMTHATDGREGFRSGWNELVEAAYVKRVPVKDDETKRIKYWETIVYEKVDLAKDEPHAEKPIVDRKSHIPETHIVESQRMENPPLISTKSNKYQEEISTKSNKEILSGTENHVPDRIPYKLIIDYLNEKAERQFKHTPNKTQTLIRARWAEGFTLDDFKRVIDIKVAEWKNDEDMKKYLRPETLFGTKFEGYLNQPMHRTKQDKAKDNLPDWAMDDAKPVQDEKVTDVEPYKERLERLRQMRTYT